MNPPLPVRSGTEVVRALQRIGFEISGQRGSHVKLRRAGSTVIVPLHRELAMGTLRSIIRQSGMTLEEFVELLQP